ncbi:MAG: hypothetical protein ACRYFS_03685 [Janthinobacterium lividum]
MNSRRTITPSLGVCMLALGATLSAHADLIKQSATYTRTVLMTSNTDHISPYTGAASTLTEQVSQAGSPMTTTALTATALGNGRFALTLTSAQTNTLGALDLNVTASGADPSDTHDQIVATDPTVDLVAGQTTITNQTTAAAQQSNTGTALIAQGYTTARAAALDTTGSNAATAVSQTTQSALSTASILALNTAAPGSPTAGSIYALEGADQTASAAVNSTLNGLISGGKFSTAALSNAPTGGSAPTVSQIAAGILANPTQPIVTNSSGYVTTSNPATGGSAVTEATIWAYGTRSLTAPVVASSVTGAVGSVTGAVGSVTAPVALASSQAFSNSTPGTVAPTWYTAAPTVSQIDQSIFGYTLAGTTFGDHVTNISSYLYGPFAVTHPTATTQTTQFSFNTLPTVQSTITTTPTGAPVSRTTTLTNQ